MEKFLCDKCGICCKSLNHSSLYSDLDRGDGTCVYLTIDNLCSIYECRPTKCNIDKMYELFFKNSLSKHDFYAINYLACEKLKNFKFKEDTIMPLPFILAGLGALGSAVAGTAAAVGTAAATAAGTVAAAAGTAATAAATAAGTAAAAAGTAAAAAGTAAAAAGTAAVGAVTTLGAVATGATGTIASAAITISSKQIAKYAVQSAIGLGAATIYGEYKSAEGHYQGKKEGYTEASATYEKKIAELTTYFLSEKKVFADKLNEYNELLNIYEQAIKELERKANKSQEELTAINNLKIVHYDLSQLEKCV